MIIDNINNLSLYPNLPEQILSFIQGNQFQEGRTDIEGDNFFAIGLNYETKNQSDGLWEAHRKYLDIHYIVQGQELVHISHIDSMIVSNDYQDDYQLFEGDKMHEVLLKKDDFLVLYPHEVHKTSIMNNEVSNVKKFVFKLLIS